ncbi:MAG: energy transducer TonB [Pseudoxanthomonas sp.]|nr:energy transducer TonB [Pseudoxanthomonas sp.]
MVTYTNHHSGATHADPAPEEPQRSSPMLIAAFALALLALGIWWYAQRQDSAPAATAPVAVQPAPASTAPAVPEQRSNAGAHRDSARVAERAPVVERRLPAPTYRAPQPLAGNPLPQYPPTALRGGEEGSVLLRIAVDARGAASDVQIIRRDGDRDRAFDRAAIEAARQWRFTPAMRNGKPVPSTVQLPVDFRRG